MNVDIMSNERGDTMLIAQITDLHIGFEPNRPDEPNRHRLDAALDRISKGVNRPALLLATGDLVDRGDIASYQRLKDALSKATVPVYPIMGNHDDRANFSAVFPEVPVVDGFIQYCIMLDGLRLILIDTLAPGRHGGEYCEVRASWLAARLAEDRATPTVIVMHHPPFAAGIAWMDTDQAEPWLQRFSGAINGHSQLIAIWCGHLHRPITSCWQGVPVNICGSTSAELTLDVNEIDPEHLDGRSMVINGPPALAFHRWKDGALVTLFDIVEDFPVLARFDTKMQGLVRHLLDERPHG